ncbi:MAG: hypothetical protein K0B06_10165 [Brevefilum sp.]|nr:hypothetical protein [Brevefilum sp.]
MSTRVRSIMVVFILLVLLGVTAGPVAAGSKTYFTATEYLVADKDPGTESFPDGRYHLRRASSETEWVATDPRLDGADALFTINWNFTFEPEPVWFSGPMWGTFVIANGSGTWKGRWTGVREENGDSFFHFVGRGSGGYEGLQLRMWGQRLDPNPYIVPTSWSGYILETGN